MNPEGLQIPGKEGKSEGRKKPSLCAGEEATRVIDSSQAYRFGQTGSSQTSSDVLAANESWAARPGGLGV